MPPPRFIRVLSLWAAVCGTVALADNETRPNDDSADTDHPVRAVLRQRCVECHHADETNGGLNLAALLDDFDPTAQARDWIAVEAAIAKGKMPPADAARLTPKETAIFQAWFDDQFVTPGGIRHPGPQRPRRLTREELQNTLEDILHVDIRATVTNSRLHVIPETVIEKFLPNGVIGESGFSNDAVTLAQENIDIQTYARCFSTVLSLVRSNEAAREKLWGMAALPDDLPAPKARDIIMRFGRSAWRRPMTNPEAAAVLGVYQKLAAQRSAADAIDAALLAMLLSPQFLYRFEEPVDQPAPLSSRELAVRLAYFLWSAPPDRELLQIAAAGNLTDDDVLKQQVARMLADPKRIALAENLGGEWFDYKKLRRQSAVNKRSDKMAGFYRTQYEEALLFFDSIIRFDQPIFRIVDADWAFLNPHQSGIYRLQTTTKNFLPQPSLPEINVHYRHRSRRIEQGNYEYQHAPLTLVGLADRNRGGFITLGPTMSVTSTENRTSPIRRGVWVMERILGEHFKVPDDVPDLEESQKKAKEQRLNLTTTEILKLHSSQDGCASCHRYIDPIGFGLEAFDQLGIGRVIPVQLSGGEKLTWSAQQTPRNYTDHTWQLAKPPAAGGETKVYFQYTRGRHRLNIRNVRLESDGVQLVDSHFGYTGNANQNNVWTFSVPPDLPVSDSPVSKPAASKPAKSDKPESKPKPNSEVSRTPTSAWRLTAEIAGDGGTDSFGTITVSGPGDRPRGYELPNGKSFVTPAELKQRLLTDYRDAIVENAIRRVLAYALGRKVEPVDRPALQRIRETIQANDHRMTSLIEAVVLSYPFRHKENR